MTTQPADAIEQLRVLIKDPQLDLSVSRGEVFGLIIEYYTRINDNDSAVEVLREMKRQVPVQLTRYIKPEILQVKTKQFQSSKLLSNSLQFIWTIP